jgi:DNA polymerase-3 subunit epsilon
MRQIILDTETTGLEADRGHRIIEIGCVELVNRRLTGRRFHRYLNPDRDIDEGALAVHGISRAQLEGEQRFHEVAGELLAFCEGAELVIHNAAFDVGFLDAELKRLPGEFRPIQSRCRVLDTLTLARELHPGQRNSLDALCKRYQVDNSGRDLHGALLDAELLVDVYLAMTGGQGALSLGTGPSTGPGGPVVHRPVARTGLRLLVREPAADELAAHEAYLALLDKQSGGRTVWRRGPGGGDAAA